MTDVIFINRGNFLQSLEFNSRVYDASHQYWVVSSKVGPSLYLNIVLGQSISVEQVQGYFWDAFIGISS
ncbi:hypothetical protein [uncultured Fructobacillus sp.]|uniref:hypothetical protein n=1 Tax=uncultured Fructobacillus sp. TaxID=591942 RepID=UPI00259964DD|nr:hypothetical protein [uncultured Fructobacillus sp.]